VLMSPRPWREAKSLAVLQGRKAQVPMIQTNDITRPPREWVEALQHIGAATTASTLNRMGIRSAFICGPLSRNPGRAVAGPALTLQFMPKREDLYGVDEYAQPELQLHRHVLYHTQPGDIVVVDGRGDLKSGVFGDMMLTYFRGKGGVGVVVDGCLRDWPNIKKLDLALWVSGGDAQLPHADRPDAVRRQRADRLRRSSRHAGRHHRRR